MIGTGIGFGVSGFVMNNGLRPVLDLYFSQEESLTALAGPTPSYSRASKGWAFNSSGVLTEHAINAPRFDHVYNAATGLWESRGLLIEEQRTNLALQSNSLSNAAWTKYRTSISSDSTLGPDGVAIPLVTTTSALAPQQFYNAAIYSLTASTNYTTSLIVKRGTCNFVGIAMAAGAANNWISAVFDLTGTANATASQTAVGASSGTIVSTSAVYLGNGFFRISMTGSTTVTGAHNIWMQFQNAATGNTFDTFGNTTTGGANGATLYAGYVQLEAGSFPTSYIPTTSASVTRSADVCQITGSGFSSIWNASEGTFVIEADCLASGTAGILSANDSTADERLEFYSSSTDPKMIIVDGGVTQADIDAGTIAASTSFKLAARYKVNDFAVSIGGAAAVTDTGGTIPTLTLLDIGKNQSGNYLNGHIARVRYYSVIHSDAILQSFST